MYLSRYVEVVLNVMIIIKVQYLVSVYRRLQFVTVKYLNRQTESHIAKGISRVQEIYS